MASIDDLRPALVIPSQPYQWKSYVSAGQASVALSRWQSTRHGSGVAFGGGSVRCMVPERARVIVVTRCILGRRSGDA